MPMILKKNNVKCFNLHTQIYYELAVYSLYFTIVHFGSYSNCAAIFCLCVRGDGGRGGGGGGGGGGLKCSFFV